MKNRKNKDGSVNAYQDTGKLGQGVTVEFSDLNFKNNIEDNILDAVLELNSKGYKTVTSCHGHSKFDYYINKSLRYNDGPQVTIELPHKVNLPNSLLISTEENSTIQSDTKNYYISIRVNSWLRYFFTNKKLCNIIIEYCKEMPNANLYTSVESDPGNYKEKSPFDNNLKQYVDPGIWNIVNELNSKGYYTICSCEGHFWPAKDIPYVTFCITDPAKYSMLYVKLKMFGVHMQLLPKWVQMSNEKEVLKNLFLTEKNVWFVFVTFNPYVFKLIKRIFKHKIKRLPNDSFY
jgi:hypothetical protein